MYKNPHTGNISIGTKDAKGYKLYVNGDIYADNLKDNTPLIYKAVLEKLIGGGYLVNKTSPTYTTLATAGIKANGTPMQDQIAIWDDKSHLRSDSKFTWDGSILNIDGSINIDTINEFTIDAGVTIDGVLIKDSKIDWSYISNTPTTFSGYAISDTLANLNVAITDATLTPSPLTTKGDIWVYSTINDRLPIGTDTQVLSADSTAATGLKWVAASSGMVYPGAGIALSTGSAWGTSITDNSANWNTAYSWGDWSVGVTKAFVDALNVDADTLDSHDSSYFVAANTAITGATHTKITYDAKGLVTSGVDATTSDIAEGTNLYYTEARVSANSSVAANTAKVTESTTVTAPLVKTGYDISIPVATSTANGYLSSTNWTTFNNKENSITAGTTAQYWRGDKSWQTLNTSIIPEGTNLYYTDARVAAKVTKAYVDSLNVDADTLDSHDSTYFQVAGNYAIISGTPADNQLATWTDATHIQGESKATFDGNTLTIAGNLHGVKESYFYLDTPNVTINATNYDIISDLRLASAYDIADGVTDSGYRMGLNISAHSDDANLLGILAEQYGIRVQYGHYSGSGGGTIINAYGLRLNYLTSGSSNVTNAYSIYSTGAAKMYHEGNVGIGTMSLASGSKLQVVGGNLAIGFLPTSSSIQRLDLRGGNIALATGGQIIAYYDDQIIARPILGTPQDITGTDYTYIRAADSGGSDGVQIQQYDGTAIATFKQGGYVGIGIIDPGTDKLYVNGTGRFTGHLGVASAPSATYPLYITGEVYSTSNMRATDFIMTSDVRLKTDISEIDNGLSIIMGLKPKMFRYKNNLEKLYFGFIAQDVEKVIPDLVSKNADGYKMLSANQIIALNTSAIQTHEKRIRVLERENKMLKKEIG